MHIVYSAISSETVVSTGENSFMSPHLSPIVNPKLQAYHEVCKKYYQEITAIQKYFPNWQPAYCYDNKNLNQI